MTDATIIAIVGAAAPTLLALATVILAIRGQAASKAGRAVTDAKVEAVTVKVEESKVQIAAVHAEVNGKMAQLIDAKAEAGYAAGKLDEKERGEQKR